MDVTKQAIDRPLISTCDAASSLFGDFDVTGRVFPSVSLMIAWCFRFCLCFKVFVLCCFKIISVCIIGKLLVLCQFPFCVTPSDVSEALWSC